MQTRRGTRWLAILTCWTIVGLLFASQTLIYYAYQGGNASPLRVVLSALADWYAWAVLAPGILWLAARCPLRDGRWRLGLLVHVPASVIFSVAKLALRFGVGSFVPWLPTPSFRMMILGQLHLNLLTYWVIVVFGHAAEYYRKYQERELHASQLEARLAHAQLEVLRMQLHPHFLFNTLHAISTLVHRDVEAADRMISQLSDLLRLTLETIGVQEVALEEELAWLDRYLAIQQTRFGDRLTVRREIQAEARGLLVPNQILQPLIENAVRHGIGVRAAGGTIELAASCRGGLLTIQVRDDGPGVASGTPDGLGLANTRARLVELYGTAHRFELSNRPGGGTIVTLAFPGRERPLPGGEAVEVSL
jgi:two-component system LytT family sensor kinase